MVPQVKARVVRGTMRGTPGDTLKVSSDRLCIYNGHGYSQSSSAYKQCCNAYSQSGSAYKQCCNAYSQSGSAHKQCCNAYSQSGSAHKQCENGLFAEHSQNFNLFQKKYISEAAEQIIYWGGATLHEVVEHDSLISLRGKGGLYWVMMESII